MRDVFMVTAMTVAPQALEELAAAEHTLAGGYLTREQIKGVQAHVQRARLLLQHLVKFDE